MLPGKEDQHSAGLLERPACFGRLAMLYGGRKKLDLSGVNFFLGAGFWEGRNGIFLVGYFL